MLGQNHVSTSPYAFTACTGTSLLERGMIRFNIILPFSIRSCKWSLFLENFRPKLHIQFSSLAYVLLYALSIHNFRNTKPVGIVYIQWGPTRCSDRNPTSSYWRSGNFSLKMLPHKIIVSFLIPDNKTNIFGVRRKQTRWGDAAPPQHFAPLCTNTLVCVCVCVCVCMCHNIDM